MRDGLRPSGQYTCSTAGVLEPRMVALKSLSLRVGWWPDRGTTKGEGKERR